MYSFFFKMYLLLSHNMVELLVFMIIYHYWDGPTNGKLFTFIKIYKKKTIPSISIPQGGRGGCGGFTHLGEMRRWSKISKHDHSIIKRQEREDGGIFFCWKKSWKFNYSLWSLLYIRPLAYFTPTGYKGAPRPCQYVNICRSTNIMYMYTTVMLHSCIWTTFSSLLFPFIPFVRRPVSFVCRPVHLCAALYLWLNDIRRHSLLSKYTKKI